MTRRNCLLTGCALALALALTGAAGAGESAPREALRIGLTPVFLDDQAAFLGEWRGYLENRLRRRVEFFQRGSYREITDMLRQGKLDLAWTCGLPYVRHRDVLRLVAVPVYRGRPLYQSYLIVPAADRATRSIGDLRGKVFAFSDPDSNSGFLYPSYALAQLGERPASFFRKTFFTAAHRKVVEAVASGVADAGAVDGYVWDTLERNHPELTARTRVAHKSPPFGHTPFVARAALPAADFEAARAVLVHMAAEPDGRALLYRLNLDGFTPGSDGLFDGIAAMARALRRG